MNAQHLYLKLFQTIDIETTILTPNRRLSATLHKLYQRYQIEQKNQFWLTPDILPMMSWIQRAWDDYVNKEFSRTAFLLSPVQEQFLWEQIISSAKESNQLLQISETAEMAKSAWNILKQWQVSTDHSAFKNGDDYIALYNWAKQYEQICQEKNYIDNANLPDKVLEKIQQQLIKPNSKIILLGFTELSPQLRKLMNSCQEVGTDVSYINLPDGAGLTHRIPLPDHDTEILSAARFAKTLIAKDSTLFIGCVFPSLEKNRDRVAEIFAEVFAENANYSNITSNLFNISAGKNLLKYPIIHTALQLLSLHKNRITVDVLAYLLNSPFLGNAENERIKRCIFDNLLRKNNISTINLRDILTKQNNISLLQHCPQLAQRLILFYKLIDINNENKTFSQWTKVFAELLKALGWPGERTLNSEEYQVVQNWLKLIADYESLDQITSSVNFQRALQIFYKLAAKAQFQGKTPDAPIQVLGVLEAAAIPFDYLWVAGMDDLSWPPQPKPHPFIPKFLQRELQMPHATAERELNFCNILINQFKHSAKQVIFSYTQKNEDMDLQASPLIKDVEETNIKDLKLDEYISRVDRVYSSKQIEYFIDEMAPPLSTNEVVKGGINIIKLQGLCPFRAFSEWRLHAHELEKILPGIRTKERGILVHKTLEIFWKKTKDHATLMTMSDKALHQQIDHSINSAMHTISLPFKPHTQYIALEKKRLHKLMWEWLHLEKNRRPFKVIDNETATQITLKDLKLMIRIDRIDQLENGKKLIIDYKTGRNNDINSWFSDRPEEPQLPLYTTIDPHNTIGISFAQVTPGENCFKGVSHDLLEINGIKVITDLKKTTAASWAEQLTQWQETLIKLGTDFSQGIAKVDPKQIPDTCTWCALKPLCRINEEALQ